MTEIKDTTNNRIGIGDKMQFNEKNDRIEGAVQKAILVGVNIEKKEEAISIDYSMNELNKLAEAAGTMVLYTVIQNKQKFDSVYYVGKGKAEEIKILCQTLDADLIIVNDELSGAQFRNLEEMIEIPVIDRTMLILDIFAQRAQSKEGKLQVELAQLRYRLPRLIGLGKSLSRTGAGIGTRGPGEKKLEVDRRHILNRISDIKREIKEIKKNRETQRKERIKNEIPIVALVGYTNSGKSTLMNKFMEEGGFYQEEKEVYVEDMLFATLDTAHRKIKLPSKEEFILIDTVGFVSKLPHTLIEAFKATLEEIQYAHLLLHIVDVTNENYEMQIKVTEKILGELNVNSKPTIFVFNKIDKIENLDSIPYRKHTVYLSAIEGQGMEVLLHKIKAVLFDDIKKVTLLLPYSRGEIVSYLCDKTNVNKFEYREDGVFVETNLGTSDYEKYRNYIILEQDEE